MRVNEYTEIKDSRADEQYSTAIGDNKPLRRPGPLKIVDGIAILSGIIIGSGIFSSPGLALSRCGGSPGEVLIAWSLSGFLVILTAHCYIE